MNGAPMGNAGEATRMSDRALWPLLLAPLLIAATLLAYANTLRSPMQFDDGASLMDNPTIRQLWPLSVPLSPPSGYGLTVEGRPLLNLSFAVNYAISGLDIRGFHITNLLIHALAGLALFGLIRRTLLTPTLRKRWGERAPVLALVGTVFWTLHPLQTESVTYVVQRAESLSGLWVLLCLYAFVRAAETPRTHRGWLGLSVVAALAGMATKEVAVIIPVLAFLYDRTFLAGSLRGAWTQRKGAHLALAATWLLLLALVLRSGSRGGTFNLADPHAWWRYGLTQLVALVRYVRLVVWPHPQVFDYGKFWVSAGAVVPHALALLLALVATGYALVRRPWLGFLGAWFFVALAPSSVLPGTIQMVVEHRMYLPLAAGAGLMVALVAWLPARVAPWIAGALAMALGLATYTRNAVYQTNVGLWEDTVAKRPGNARAVANLGSALYSDGQFARAETRLREALRMDATNPECHFNLGLTLMALKRPAEAAPAFAEAARLKPRLATAHLKHAVALNELGRHAEAMAALGRAIAEWPNYVEAHDNLGQLLLDDGRPAEALEHFRRALAEQPEYTLAGVHAGMALLRLDRTNEAIDLLRRALKRDPKLALAHFNLGVAYDAAGDHGAARAAYAESVRLDPEDGEARLNYGIALARAGELTLAQPELEAAVRLRPEAPEARLNYGIVLAELGRLADAVPQYETALRLRPAYVAAHYNYGNTLLRLGRVAEARLQFLRALALDGHFAPAQEMLARIDAADGAR
ncbi:tetratricopeptide repeat protein [Opitutus sp. ER46]|uniref:tetratricopeptide repeat protein n=1 Tax=Opitutus sp. ER46 TaxID=2161864 RepID=UPI000D2F9839|nr:tetratricopeptide repeat protein [Opitutus sp. ER46]PTX94368.1 hypothetical protein DB354_11475 [Opitutus sp. ER46]